MGSLHSGWQTTRPGSQCGLRADLTAGWLDRRAVGLVPSEASGKATEGAFRAAAAHWLADQAQRVDSVFGYLREPAE
jgi:hypothetical protein